MVQNLEDRLSEKTDRRSFLRFAGRTLGTAAIGLMLFGDAPVQIASQLVTGHSKPITGGLVACKPTPEQKTEYEHVVSLNASYLFGGGIASGTYEVTMQSTGAKSTGTIGQSLTLAKTTNQTELCTILVKGDGALPREYTNVPITNTNITTNLAELAQLDVNRLLAEVLVYGGKNASMKPTNLNIYFGSGLPQNYIDKMKSAFFKINEWTNNRYTLTFHENVDKPIDTTVPPDGDMWIRLRSDVSGASNVTYPTSGGKVSSAKVDINLAGAGLSMVYNEIGDAFVYGEQNALMGDPSAPYWFKFMADRPKDTNNYLVSTGKETQSGLDTSTGVQNYAQMSYRIQTSDSGLFGPNMPDSIVPGSERMIGPEDAPLRPSERAAERETRRVK